MHRPCHSYPLRVICGWNNTTEHDLGWPEEMCAGLVYYSQGQGCTIDSPQCRSLLMCLAPFDDTANYCSVIFCEDSAQ